MISTENEEHEFENNKALISSVAQEDGKLVSPIDLSLDNTKHLVLDRLKWMNLDKMPHKMKLTNTGETVIISGKWSSDRPYLCGGPLNGNYVFSQIHFHWGSDEHEGSEHTVRGISYPMEVHVVFYKSRYLTQDAALKMDDGVIVVVYLVKLQEKTTPALHWLANHLEKVVQPQTSSPLPLSPLSALLVPFNQDYLLYWGLLVTHRCSHTMLWIVSRAAFSITVEHLNIFRKLLNSRKEPMNKNFRGASPTQGRTVFHINPSGENKHLLLPGAINPPDHAIIVNYSQMQPLDYAQAQKIFNKGDGTDDEKKNEPQSYKLKNAISSSKTYTFCEGSQREEVDTINNNMQLLKSSTKAASHESCSSFSNESNSRSERRRLLREDNIHKTKSQKRRHVLNRKNLEKERKQDFYKIKKFIKTDDIRMKCGKIIKKSYSNKSLENVDICINIHEQSERRDENNNKDNFLNEIKNDENILEDLCHSSKISSSEIKDSKKVENLKTHSETDNLEENQTKTQEKSYKETSKCKPIKSRLPVRKGLQSTLAPYFSQLDSTQRQRSVKSDHPTSPKLNCDVRKPITTIPRLIGKNAGKLEENCGIHTLCCPPRRPTSSPTKLTQQKNKC